MLHASFGRRDASCSRRSRSSGRGFGRLAQ